MDNHTKGKILSQLIDLNYRIETALKSYAEADIDFEDLVEEASKIEDTLSVIVQVCERS